jgi:peptide/nickel transport system permease protein
MSFAFSTVGAMVAEVGIAVIGLGPSDAISLGMLINFASGWGAFARGLYLMLLLPPAILVLIFLSLTLINRGMEEYLNPRLQNVTGQ